MIVISSDHSERVIYQFREGQEELLLQSQLLNSEIRVLQGKGKMFDGFFKRPLGFFILL